MAMDPKTRQRRQQAKAARRRARFGARVRQASVRFSPGGRSLETERQTELAPSKRRTGRRGRRVSQRVLDQRTGAGVEVLEAALKALAPRRLRPGDGQRRAERDAKRHREQWSASVHAQAEQDRKAAAQARARRVKRSDSTPVDEQLAEAA